MSTIATLTSTESGANSLIDINNNFSNLNTDKVEGQSASVDSEVALFSGTGGKTIKRASSSGIANLTSGVLGVKSTTGSGNVVLDTSPTIVTPTIASFANATHNHSNAAGGGTVAESVITFTDITTNDVSTTKHGFVPKAPNNTTTFLRGDASWAAPVLSLTFKNGTTTKDASDASATQNIAHGLGATPKQVRIKAICEGAGGAGDSILAISETVYNGTTQSSVSFYTTSTNFASGNGTVATTFTLNINGASGTQTGVVTVDATNIIITWTKTNSPTGTYTLLWEAIA